MVLSTIIQLYNRQEHKIDLIESFRVYRWRCVGRVHRNDEEPQTKDRDISHLCQADHYLSQSPH